jgi:hypothetical protein
VSAPRAPRDPELLLLSVVILRRNGQDEVADMLEDIASGKWTLTNATYRGEPS